MNALGKHVAPERPWGAAVRTVLVYLLLGPLIGGLLYMTITMLISELSAILNSGQSQLRGTRQYYGPYVVFILSLSYIVGFLPALGCGLVHATYSWKIGQLPFWLALALGILNFLIAGVLQWFENAVMAIAMFFAFMVSVVLCWLVSNRFWWTRS